MNGWDFHILWEAGRAVLSGQNPYSVEFFFYPLPFAYFMAVLGLFPFGAAFALWAIMNLGLLIAAFRRRFIFWLLYVPVLHLFSAGQVGLLFWSLERGINRSLRGALLGALMTLQPQAALILLPWHLFDWLRHDRRTLLYWLGMSLALWGVPLLWFPTWPQEWLASTPRADLIVTLSNTPGIFSLLQIAPGLLVVLAPLAVGIALWGLTQNKMMSRACIMLASPVGLFYSTIYMLGAAPALLLVPLSIAAAALSILANTFIPFLSLPLAVAIWQWRQRKKPLPIREPTVSQGVAP